MLAGCSVYGRPHTLQEAWDAAAGVCNIGLEIRTLRPRLSNLVMARDFWC